MGAPAAAAAPTSSASNVDHLNSQVKAAGDKVRDLKAKKAEKAVIDVAVKELLALKAEFKSVSGKDWSPNMSPTPAPAPPKAEEKSAPPQIIRSVTKSKRPVIKFES